MSNNETDNLPVTENKELITKLSKFDPSFQRTILKLALDDDYFCGKLVKNLRTKELKNKPIFSLKELQFIFNSIADYFEDNNVRPKDSILKQMIHDYRDKEGNTLDSNLVKKTVAYIDNIYKIQLNESDELHYRKYLTKWVKKHYMLQSILDSRKNLEKDPELAATKMLAKMEKIQQVNFEEEKILRLTDIPKFISKKKEKNGGKIPTGIKLLDKDLHGGLPRQHLVTVVAGTNAGKSMFCLNLGSQALKAQNPMTQKNAGF